MNALDHFTIPVSGLRDGLHAYDFHIDSEFFGQFEGSPITDADVAVHFVFDKRPGLYVLTFSFEGTVKATCDRCLEVFDLPVADEQTLLVKFDEKEWEDADVIYIPQGTQKLNVARYIYEFVNLAVPIIKTHEDAEENCDPEMLKFIEPDTAEEEDNAGSVWDSLKGLNLEN